MKTLRFSSSRLPRASAAALIFACTGACAEGSTPQPGTISSGGAAGSMGGSAGDDSSSVAGSSGMAGQGAGGEAPINIPWQWAGIVGTGQSLAVGDNGSARGSADATVRATTQPFGNMKLSTGSAVWPVDPDDRSLTLVPLIEPIGRPAPNYPSSWPTNIAGETPHAAMANQITALVQDAGGADYVSVHSEVGENGQCLSFLVKGALPMGAMDVRAHAYEATLIETRAITRLAQEAGKTYGVGAIIVTHGECDNGTVGYAAQLHQLWSDYKADLSAITGQTQPPLLIVSQQNSQGDRSVSTLEQRRVGVDYPADAVCSGPKYQYPYGPDGVHLLVAGYEQLGEKYAQVYYERVVRGRDWRPLEPTGVQRDGRVLHVRFHVPVPPLAWEETFQAPHQGTLSEWSQGKGFEVRGGAGNIAISAVELSGDGVDITCATDLPATGVTVGYALTGDGASMAAPFAGTKYWGQLRDSDPFVGSTTQTPQPNFAVAFELPVPNG
ncbi:MAG: dockerin [Deltaproteobacteria bacterium]